MSNRKDKFVTQREDRDAAKARRRGEPNLTRAAPNRQTKPTILIVCEGENTEPSYFDSFRLSSATVESYGGRKQPVNVVKHAIYLASQKKYDEVWCVFDKDDISDEDFNDAIDQAEAAGFKVAYSNQAFEYWFILHFEDHKGGPMPRADYHNRINGYINPLGAYYDGKKSKTVSSAFFDALDGFDIVKKETRIQLAVNRAGRIHGRCKKAGVSPAKSESCTTVYQLIKRFLKYR
ncbi:RloB family protein [Larkinella sp.]|uniref:RloB family protein n=1 Tax=Larkinella sp. TaxID=2034517 RepID=UPI003BAC7F50